MVISIPEFFKMMMIQFLPSPEMAEEAPPPTFYNNRISPLLKYPPAAQAPHFLKLRTL